MAKAMDLTVPSKYSLTLNMDNFSEGLKRGAQYAQAVYVRHPLCAAKNAQLCNLKAGFLAGWRGRLAEVRVCRPLLALLGSENNL
jgi:hypothetical protein